MRKVLLVSRLNVEEFCYTTEIHPDDLIVDQHIIQDCSFYVESELILQLKLKISEIVGPRINDGLLIVKIVVDDIVIKSQDESYPRHFDPERINLDERTIFRCCPDWRPYFE